jgi:SagB-type dehydrogenase family enzyme
MDISELAATLHIATRNLSLHKRYRAVVLVFTCAFGRLSAKYGPRSYRLGYLDVGHASAQGYPAATALGLHACASAGFIDEAVDALLGIDGLDTASVLVQAVGAHP